MKTCAPLLFLLFAASAHAEGVEVAPSTAEAFEGILSQLEQTHRIPAWCVENCATFLEIHVGGDLARGDVTVEINGVADTLYPSYLRLFGASASLALDDVQTQANKRLPLFWFDDAYSTVVQPGSFTLRSTGHVKPNTPFTLTVPGPAGLVSFDLKNADIVGREEARGVTDATYYVTPQVHQAAQAHEDTAALRLRLQTQRTFALGRERTFATAVQAQGAKIGQVIVLPVLAAEAIERFIPDAAHVRGSGAARTIEWVADGSSPSLRYEGKWTAENIVLKAPSGAVKEVWTVVCDDPYQCAFKGDAEVRVGSTSHTWEPLPGQTLEVATTKLEPHSSVQTVAQRMEVRTRAAGHALRQDVRIQYNASASTVVSLLLPENAAVSSFELDGDAIPMLKNAAGQLQVSLPSGISQLHSEWEVPEQSFFSALFLSAPTPRLSVPVSTLMHALSVAEDTSVVSAGGLPGSPRITLWPNLGALLALAGVVFYGCRAVGQPLASPALWWPVALGFAIDEPASILPFVCLLILGRWLGRAARPRRAWLMWIELAIWAALALSALGLAADTLRHALFATAPFEVSSYVTLDTPTPAWFSGVELAWGAFLSGAAGPLDTLPSVWMICAPLLLIRLLWAAWAVAFVLFLRREGPQILAQVSRYWAAATSGSAAKITAGP